MLEEGVASNLSFDDLPPLGGDGLFDDDGFIRPDLDGEDERELGSHM